MEVLSSNQPNLTLVYVLSLILFEILFHPLLLPIITFNMKVSNKKALATLNTVHK